MYGTPYPQQGGWGGPAPNGGFAGDYGAQAAAPVNYAQQQEGGCYSNAQYGECYGGRMQDGTGYDGGCNQQMYGGACGGAYGGAPYSAGAGNMQPNMQPQGGFPPDAYNSGPANVAGNMGGGGGGGGKCAGKGGGGGGMFSACSGGKGGGSGGGCMQNGGCGGGGYGGYGGGCNYGGGGGFRGDSYPSFGYDDEYEFDDFPRYNQGTGPVYAQDTLGEYQFDGQARVTILGKQGEVVPTALTTFDQCDAVFPPVIMSQMRDSGFTTPTPVQATTWPVALQGRDVIGVAKTGSGKTLAYMLPGFMRIFQGQATGRGPHILVLAPTRELARQIEQEAEKFGACMRIRAACFYGGAPRGPQLGQLRRGAQVVVATPGRLNDFLDANQVNLSNAKYCVLDEADRMLDMGFEPQIRQVLQKAPSPRQMLLYTATWAKEVRSLASDFLTNPFCVNVGHDNLVANEDVEQHVVICQHDNQKLEELRKILEQCVQGDLVLVFCDTKTGCAWLGDHLYTAYRIPCVALHGDLAQRDRDYAIDAFKSGRKPIMIGTDVAARGLDIKGIKVVVNFNPAAGSEDYVHRIGRTGRAGSKGLAYTFLLPKESKKARDIVKVMEAGKVPVPPELQSLAGTGQRGMRKGKGKGKGGKGGFGGKGRSKGGGKGGGFGGKGGGGGYKGGNRDGGGGGDAGFGGK